MELWVKLLMTLGWIGVVYVGLMGFMKAETKAGRRLAVCAGFAAAVMLPALFKMWVG